MAISVQEFWQLAVASGLHDEADCRRLADAFAAARDDGTIAKDKSLPEWMLETGALTRYQAKILLAGRPGPFAYGDYVISDRLESPAAAGLFRAVHRPTGVKVCLQFLRGAALTDSGVLALLAQMTASAARLSRPTPYLTHCHALVDLHDYKFIVIDNLPSRTVDDLLAAHGPLRPKDAVRVLWQAASGLAALHKAGEAHGHIRPDRIWLSSDRTARLAAFPLAADPLAMAIVDPSAAPDPAARAYAAPECRAGAPPTPVADIYSLGCALYHMLAGEPPFAVEADEVVAIDDPRVPVPLEQRKPDVAAPLAALVARLMDDKPARRFPTAAELLTAIEPIAKRCGCDTGSVAPPPARVQLDEWLSANGELPVAPEEGGAVVAPVLIAPSAAPVTFTPVVKRASRKPVPRIAVIGGAAAALLLIAGTAAIYFLGGAGNSVAPKGMPGTVAGGNTQADAAKDAALPDADRTAAGEGTPPRTNDIADAAVAGASKTNGGASGAATGDRPLAAHDRTPAPRVDTVVGIDAPMWAAPTHGAPLELKYLPPGAEVIVALRPRQIVARAEGARLLDVRTSGMVGRFLGEEVPALVGPLEHVEQLFIAFFDAADGTPRWSLTATLDASASEDELRKLWGNPEEKTRDNTTYFQAGERVFFLPGPEPRGRVIVVGPADMIVDEVLPSAGEPPLLRRELEALLASSDADRDITMMAVPSVLLTGGNLWLSGPAARLLTPLKWFLSGGDGSAIESATSAVEAASASGAHTVDLASQGLPKAALVSAHLTNDDLFAELRVYVAAERPAQIVAREYRERVARLPKLVSESIRGLALTDYSRDILFGFPLMIEQLERHTVAGTDPHQAVLRMYLPSVAAHNLALATHLALLEPLRNAAPSAGARTPAPQAANGAGTPPQPLGGRLDRKMSLVFDRAPLERALQIVSDEIDVPLEILGKDLQAEGITKNQSFAMEERDLPAREILRKIMLKANPDGKLVYIIKPSEAGTETLYITTRAAVRQRGDTLPPELAAPAK